jgi:hypothetical protein
MLVSWAWKAGATIVLPTALPLMVLVAVVDVVTVC